MGAVIEYPTLEHVAQEARPYPDELLEGLDSGLCLFAAAYLGHNDAIHFAKAGLLGTCVDIDEERLLAMRALYPPEWQFTYADAWRYAEAARDMELAWDVVSVDTFTGDAMVRSLRSLELWTAIANELVTVTATDGARFSSPSGWRVEQYERAPGVYWLVLRRDRARS